MQTTDAWPAGATWVFQGTVAEDATAGTHLSSLTVTPGAGNEFQFLYGGFKAGAGAANLVSAWIDDGTNKLTFLVGGFDGSTLSLASSVGISIPPLPVSGLVIANDTVLPSPGLIVSGTMRLIIQVSTATVSLTHTFALVCRLKTSALPTATLADSVGVPTLTTNTNRVF